MLWACTHAISHNFPLVLFRTQVCTAQLLRNLERRRDPLVALTLQGGEVGQIGGLRRRSVGILPSSSSMPSFIKHSLLDHFHSFPLVFTSFLSSCSSVLKTKTGGADRSADGNASSSALKGPSSSRPASSGMTHEPPAC